MPMPPAAETAGTFVNMEGRVQSFHAVVKPRDDARPDPPATFIGRPPKAVLPPTDGPRLAGLPGSGGISFLCHANTPLWNP